MNEPQLNGKLVELEKELLKLNGQRAMHTTLENPGKVKLIRKTKARILTRLNSIKLEAAQKPVAKVKSKQEAKSNTSKPKTPSKETGGKSERHE